MSVPEFMSEAQDVMTVKRVFGEPYEKDGITFIPAARIMGGGGGGGGGDETGNLGSGGGFGVVAMPMGAYVIKDGKISWQPVIDVNRVILGGQLVVVVMLLTLRAILKARAKAAARS